MRALPIMAVQATYAAETEAAAGETSQRAQQLGEQLAAEQARRTQAETELAAAREEVEDSRQTLKNAAAQNGGGAYTIAAAQQVR